MYFTCPTEQYSEDYRRRHDWVSHKRQFEEWGIGLSQYPDSNVSQNYSTMNSALFNKDENLHIII